MKFPGRVYAKWDSESKAVRTPLFWKNKYVHVRRLEKLWPPPLEVSGILTRSKEKNIVKKSAPTPKLTYDKPLSGIEDLYVGMDHSSS